MLNTEHFVLLAGDPSEMDAEIRRRCSPGSIPGTFESEGLCALQVEQARRGRLGVRLHQTIYGWSVRYDSGLQGFGLLRGHMTKEEAIAFGVAWVNEAPESREFYAYRTDVEVSS